MSITINSIIEESAPRYDEPEKHEDRVSLAALDVFQAQGNPKPKPTLAQYAIKAVLLSIPIIALYYLLCRACNGIAIYCGIGSKAQRKHVDEAKRKQLDGLPSGKGINVYFKAEDGLLLEGKHFTAITPNKTGKTILICSGSHQSYEQYVVPMVDALLSRGHHVMIFNYRGFGQSDGSPSEEGFYKDAEAAYQYLVQKHGVNNDQLIAFGYSMGSAVATDLAARHKGVDLVLDRYFSSMEDVAGNMGTWVAKLVFTAGGVKFDLTKKIQAVEGRIFCAQSNKSEGERRYEARLKKSLESVKKEAQFIQLNVPHFHDELNPTVKMPLWFHSHNVWTKQEQKQLTQFLTNQSI